MDLSLLFPEVFQILYMKLRSIMCRIKSTIMYLLQNPVIGFSSLKVCIAIWYNYFIGMKSSQLTPRSVMLTYTIGL